MLTIVVALIVDAILAALVMLAWPVTFPLWVLYLTARQ